MKSIAVMNWDADTINYIAKKEGKAIEEIVAEMIDDYIDKHEID